MKSNDKAVAIATDNLKVQVAKDVLKYLKYFNLTHSGYFYGDSNTIEEASTPETILPLCEVCALGACYVSSMLLSGKTPSQNDEADEVAISIFGQDNAALIEAAYEKWPARITGKLTFAAKEFGERYKDDYERLGAIMENVITHDGEFVPTEAA